MPTHPEALTPGFDNPLAVAIVADPDPAQLPPAHARLLEVLAAAPLPGVRLDLPGRGMTAGPDHDLIHLLGGTGRPRPVGGPGSRSGAAALAREHGIGLVAHYPAAPRLVRPSECRIVLSPSAAADAELLLCGARPEQLRRWRPGVDPEAFGPGHFRADRLARAGGRIHVLCAERTGASELLEAAWAAAVVREPRLQRVHLSTATGPHVTTAERAAWLASADLLLCLDAGPDVPLDVVEAQASGLPVLAVDGGGVREVVEDGRDGVLVPATASAIADALVALARRATLRERLIVGGLSAARERGWEPALTGLANAWATALRRGAGLVRAA